MTTSKRFFSICILAVSILLSSIAQSQSNKVIINGVVTGRVLDVKTGLPLIGSNVYIANSILGAATDQDGRFVIYQVPNGTHQIISSYIGYEIEKKQVTVKKPDLYKVDFWLSSKVGRLGEVVVTADMGDKNWKKRLKIFEEEFLGMTENARKCEILNPEVLTFNLNSRTGVLEAKASDILIVENRALGYRMNIILEEFSYLKDLSIMTVVPTFMELVPKDQKELKKWMKARDIAYYGSLRHFLASLAAGTSTSDGFELSSVKGMTKEEYENPVVVNPDALIKDGSTDHEKKISFDNLLFVIYHREDETKKYISFLKKKKVFERRLDFREQRQRGNAQASFLELPDGEVVFNNDGSVQYPHKVIAHGFLSHERFAESLPQEYNPRVNKVANTSFITGNKDLDEFWKGARPETQYFGMLDAVNEKDYEYRIEYPMMLVMGEENKSLYNAEPSFEDKKAFIKKYIKSKDNNPLYPVNYWFLDFFSRVDFTQKNFAINEPPFFDDRGEVYIKFGKPLNRYQDKGGLKISEMLRDASNIYFELKDLPESGDPIKHEFLKNQYQNPRKSLFNGNVPDYQFNVKPNETWYYSDGKQEIHIHFVKEGEFKRKDSLLDALYSGNNKASIWQWMELIKERVSVSTDYSSLGMDVMHFEAYFTGLEQNTIPASEAEGRDAVNLILGKEASEFQGNKPQDFIISKEIRQDRKDTNALRTALPTVGQKYDEINLIPFGKEISQFRRGEKTKVDIVLQVPMDKVLNKRMGSAKTDILNLGHSYLIQNKDFNEVFRREAITKYPVTASKELDIDNAIGTVSFDIAPIDGMLTIQMTDNYNLNHGFSKEDISIRDFSGDDLMISDIQFYTEPPDEAMKNIVPTKVIDGVTVSHYPYEKLHRSSPIYCYFELYNIQSSVLTGEYQIEISTNIPDSIVTVKDKVEQNIRRNLVLDEPTLLSISQTRVPENDTSFELIALDMSEITKHKYLLEVIIKKMDGTVLTSARRWIEIFE